MDTATKERYVLYHLSLIDMDRVTRSLSLLSEVHDDYLREALFRDAVICYAKPFSSNNALDGKARIRVKASFVPQALTSTHKEIIKLRNQLFAHMDIDKQAPNISIETINGEKYISFSVTGYERVFTDHLVVPLQTLAKTTHSFLMQELEKIRQQ